MKKTATITFHAAHNYGTMLQAYALQKIILGLGVDNDIINLRTDIQKDFYRLPQEKGIDLRSRISRARLGLLFGNYMRNQKTKFAKFEKFLADYLKMTPETGHVCSESDFGEVYDCYITGSDQCWNIGAIDFDWSFFLDFVGKAERISYATCSGLVKQPTDNEKAAGLLRAYNAISVRDEGTREFVREMTGREAEILPDPTLLPEREMWAKMAGETPIEKGRYIFFYTPYEKAGLYDVADKISRVTGLPIVISNHTDHRAESILRLKGRLRAHVDAGPLEFLNLVRNAALTVTGSYHGLLFSLIFHVPFWAFKGDTDLRMKQVLEHYGFEDRFVRADDAEAEIRAKAARSFETDFTKFDTAIVRDRERALAFLRRNLLQ